MSKSEKTNKGAGSLRTFPEELRNVKQWSISYSEEELKRPLHHTYPPNGAYNAETAISNAGDNLLTGFYVTDKDPYILGDIDHIDDPENLFAALPDELAYFLKKKATYFETSPSGQGVRFLLKLPSVEDKQVLNGNVFYVRGAKDKRSVQINVRQPWMTITRNPLSFSTPEIAQTSIEELDTVFEIKYKSLVAEEKKKSPDMVKLPTLSEVAELLSTLPLDKNPRIRRAYERVVGHKYEHYDYWIKVLMGIHHYAINANKKIDCFEMILAWSEKDPDSFTSEADVKKHWRSFDEQEYGEITILTVFKMLYAYILKWPAPKAQTKAEKEAGIKRKPLNSEYVNFQALVNHFGLKLLRNELNFNEFYIEGDIDVLNEHFIKYRVQVHYDRYYGPFDIKSLTPTFHAFMQRMGFTGISHGTVKGFIQNYLVESLDEVNLIRIYFDTPFQELPTVNQENAATFHSSNVEYLFNCLTINPQYAGTDKEQMELELYRRYYKCWLMGIVRTLFFPDSKNINNCVLLLTGKEQIRKTSHFLYLLPRFMRDMCIASTTHGFSNEGDVRDLAKIASSSLIVFWDEIEQYLNSKTESNFKKVIDSVKQKFIDKYEVLPTTLEPKAIYGATSNKSEFKLSDTGSRRLFHIPVEWVDTNKMDTVNWYSLINRLRDECTAALEKGEIPWLLSEEELQLQADLHVSITDKSSMDIVLNQVWDFEIEFDFLEDVKSLQTDKTGRLMSISQVKSTMKKYNIQLGIRDEVRLSKALQTQCARYTKTSREPLPLNAPKCTIVRGVAQQGPYKRYVMPPINDSIKETLFSDIEIE